MTSTNTKSLSGGGSSSGNLVTDEIRRTRSGGNCCETCGWISTRGNETVGSKR